MRARGARVVGLRERTGEDGYRRIVPSREVFQSNGVGAVVRELRDFRRDRAFLVPPAPCKRYGTESKAWCGPPQ